MTKLNASGSALMYSTYLGGEGTDRGYGIAVDSLGTACVVGVTDSAIFPLAFPFQSTKGGNIFARDAFVTRIVMNQLP